MRRLGGLIVAGLLVVVVSACSPPLGTPGDVASVQLVSSSNLNGWKYGYDRNTAYPCSVSGYQTFVIGTKIGSSATSPAPLWTFMHGGGAGYFDTSGNPVPGTGQKTEESATSLRGHLTNNGLLASVRGDAAAFRTLAVSYCSHDVYAGANTPDPHNPNTTPDGKPRTTNGVLSTKAAVQYARAHYSDDQDVPARWQRGVRRDIRGRLVDAAAAHRAGRCRRRREHRQPRGVRRRVRTGRLRGQERPRAARSGHGPRASGARRHRQRARQAGGRRQAHRAADAHLEPRRREHLWLGSRSRVHAATGHM